MTIVNQGTNPMDLQNTYYALGIVVMSLILILLIILVAAVLVIRVRVNAIHRMVEEKIELIARLAIPMTAASKVIREVKKSVHPKR